MNKCNCLLGILNDTVDIKIYKDDYLKELKKYCSFISNDLTPKSILDQRKGYSYKFNYCPKCGEKINWKKLI